MIVVVQFRHHRLYPGILIPLSDFGRGYPFVSSFDGFSLVSIFYTFDKEVDILQEAV